MYVHPGVSWYVHLKISVRETVDWPVLCAVRIRVVGTDAEMVETAALRGASARIRAIRLTATVLVAALETKPMR